jgi:hypothetical protein
LWAMNLRENRFGEHNILRFEIGFLCVSVCV